jgi:hypothetical protein
MPSRCYTPFKIPRVRATLLDECGTPVTGSCSTVVTDGIISVEMTKEYEDREEFFVKNGDGTFCVRETNAPILKWINLVLTFCNVDPELVNIMTAEPIVYDDAATPNATGYSTQEGSAALANFALEGWTRLSGLSDPCTGGVEYGYFLWPWIVEGTIGDMTLENGVANFVVNARTHSSSPWGTGPYFVDYSDNPVGSTTDIALLTPITSIQHMRNFITRKPPPTAACGCTALNSLTPS